MDQLPAAAAAPTSERAETVLLPLLRIVVRRPSAHAHIYIFIGAGSEPGRQACGSVDEGMNEWATKRETETDRERQRDRDRQRAQLPATWDSGYGAAKKRRQGRELN
eukprot:GHVU01110795.1.p1 GENE.GHVU01110795.1~~GHVU01110795.1.p1  ORF type:complete len:107 (-),score=15.34 GHVU01110795.1:470-790(-)